GPDWRGTLPKGVTEVRAPTGMVWLIGRFQTNGKGDYGNVHRLQDQLRLVQLSAWRKGNRNPPPAMPRVGLIDTETPPAEQVAAMDAQAFFSRMAALLQTNPPGPD
ncbi:DUF1254 domain-containing protein, partial [Klebsiella pneumoniae]|uniref:DUF1254 domain-containing protein n=2 Tax=Pseudomonadota TaxID=1224 RepID=UPI002157F0C4